VDKEERGAITDYVSKALELEQKDVLRRVDAPLDKEGDVAAAIAADRRQATQVSFTVAWTLTWTLSTSIDRTLTIEGDNGRRDRGGPPAGDTGEGQPTLTWISMPTWF